MYSITIGNDEPLQAADYAVVNLDGDKTLYIRLPDETVVGYKINDVDVHVYSREDF